VGGFSSGAGSPTDRRSARAACCGLIDTRPYPLRSLGVTPWTVCRVMASIPRMHPDGRPQLLGAYSPPKLMAPHQAIGGETMNARARQQVRRPRHRLSPGGPGGAAAGCVYNHTSEGKPDTVPIPSAWRRLADRLYYQQNESSEYRNVTGCGNTIAANPAAGAGRLISEVDALLPWSWHRWLPLRSGAIASSRGENMLALSGRRLSRRSKPMPELSDLKSW